METSGSRGTTGLPAGPARKNDAMIRWTLGIGALLVMGMLGLIFLALVGALSTVGERR